MSTVYVPYRPEVETILPDEDQTIEDILASMHRLSNRTKAMYGHQVCRLVLPTAWKPIGRWVPSCGLGSGRIRKWPACAVRGTASRWRSRRPLSRCQPKNKAYPLLNQTFIHSLGLQQG